MTKLRTFGFTLIELLIAMGIFVFLIMIAGPMYAEFMGNSQIRNAAENTLTGVRLAQTSAVQSNKAAKFVLDTSVAGGWTVSVYNDETAAYDPPIQAYKWEEGASRTSVTPLPGGASTVTFDGLGRVVANGYPAVADGTASLTRVDVTNTSVTAGTRALRIQISAVGGTAATKLCDPAVSTSNDPRICS
jgi:type IV fimbrial biogenesis protein FimT